MDEDEKLVLLAIGNIARELKILENLGMSLGVTSYSEILEAQAQDLLSIAQSYEKENEKHA